MNASTDLETVVNAVKKNKGNNKVSDNSLLAALNGLHSGAAKSNLDLGSINGKKAKKMLTELSFMNLPEEAIRLLEKPEDTPG